MVLSFILQNSLLLFLFGLGVFIIGTALVIQIILSARTHYIVIRSGKNGVHIGEDVIESYLNSYWKELFPGREIPTRLLIKKRKIKVFADLPFIPEEDQKSLLEKVEEDLSKLFRDILGYPNELDLLISFGSEKS